MNLNDLTKADLVWFINRMKMYCCGSREYDRAMDDLMGKEMDRQVQIAHDARVAYLDLMKPYDGKRLIDIPLDVAKKADAVMRRAQAADRKWYKLMKEADNGNL